MTKPATATPRESITFRPCTDDDVPFLRHLYGTTREDELRPVPWTDEEKRGFLDMQFAAQKAHYEEHYPGCAFLVIELEGRPIGRLYVDRGEEDIRIVDITLVPEIRGRGIGGMLMAELLAEGQATKKSVSIHVEHDNPAQRLTSGSASGTSIPTASTTSWNGGRTRRAVGFSRAAARRDWGSSPRRTP